MAVARRDVSRAPALRRARRGQRTAAPASVELAALIRRSEGPAAATGPSSNGPWRSIPNTPRALLLLGDDRREAGRLEEADVLYDRALTARPDFYWAWIGKAAVQRGLGRIEEAGAHLDAAAEIDPAEGIAQIERALDLCALGKPEAARARLAGISAASPRAAQAAMAEAQIVRATGDWADASHRFEAVARQWPDRIDALVEAAEDAFRGGDAERAERFLAEALTSAPAHPLCLEAEARRAMIRDEPDEALGLYRRAEAADSGRLAPVLAARGS